MEVAAMVGHTPQLALRPYANGRVVPPPPPLPVASFLTVGFVGRVGQHLGRIFLPKMTAKGTGTANCQACREEGEGGGGGRGTV